MNIQIFTVILVIVALVVPVVQYHIQALGYMGVSAVFINDTSSYWENIKLFHEGVASRYYTIIGILILYYPAFTFGWMYCLLVNFLLLILSAVVYEKTLPYLKIKISDKQIISVFILILSNFYLWGVLYFPNKEIPLIFLTNLMIYALASKKNKLFVIIIIVAIFFFRDGFAFIMFCIVGLIWTFRRFIQRNPVKFLCLIMFVLMFFSLKTLSALGLLSEYQYVIDRNIEYDAGTKFASNLPYFIGYLINVLNNSIGYAIRAQLIDVNYRLYFHGIGLWHFSVSLVLGLISWCVYAFKKPKKDNMIIFMAVILCLGLLFLSTSSYPQARYMMPFFFWLATGVFFYFNIRVIVVIYAIIFVFAFLLIVLGLSHKLGLGIDIDNFSKSIF